MSRNPKTPEWGHGGMLGQHWEVLGQHWDVLGCCAEARGPSKPPGAGEGLWDGDSLAALKQVLQLAHVHTFGVGSDAQVPSGVAKGHFLCHSPHVLGGIQLNPKCSAPKWKEKALCSQG